MNGKVFHRHTVAAAAGGITTLIEMPHEQHSGNNNRRAAFHTKIAAACGKLSVDTGFWGRRLPRQRSTSFAGLGEAGCFGFKCFGSIAACKSSPVSAKPDLRRSAAYPRKNWPRRCSATVELPGPHSRSGETPP